MQIVVRTTGKINPCCDFVSSPYNINNHTVSEYMQSDFLQNIRNQMLNGQQVPGCEKCTRSEKLMGTSARIEALRDYKFFSEKHYLKLLDYYKWQDKKYPSRFEFHTGNLCNLKCLTCRPEDSSAFLSENKILKISNHSQSDYTVSDTHVKKLLSEVTSDNNLDLLDLRGGESMLSPIIKKVLLEYAGSEKLKETTLRIQTNGTILDDDWKKILNNFKKVELMVSIDAYGDDNHYIRYPANWNAIENNVFYFKNIPNSKVYIHCTVSNLNLLVLDKLLNWTEQKNIFLHCAPLTNYREFMTTTLPEKLYNQALSRLSDWRLKNESVNSICNIEYNFDKESWEKFKKVITLRDNYRQNSIFDILPEFRDHWE